VPAETEAPAPEATAASASAPVELTAEELAAFDGQNGNPAYVAVDGVVYDVTNVPAWKNGAHNGNQAGKDLSDVIGKAPHKDSVLKNLKVVGKLK
jgi:predicted heme/steroid binding protein